MLPHRPQEGARLAECAKLGGRRGAVQAANRGTCSTPELAVGAGEPPGGSSGRAAGLCGPSVSGKSERAVTGGEAVLLQQGAQRSVERNAA
eukprot:13391510-Alexandrium_andersonii.AAC.1